MKSHIKKFGAFINEESGYYPAGTENDPRAPWNQRDDDDDVVRDNDWIDYHPEKSKFSFIAMADEYVLLKHKESGELYLMYSDAEEVEEYAPRIERRTYIGRDEDGDADYDTETEHMPLDDRGAEAFATDNIESAGTGLEDWENGATLVKLDDDLKADLIADFAKDYERGRNQVKALAILKALDSPLH